MDDGSPGCRSHPQCAERVENGKCVSANMNIKGKGFRIVVKPALLYGVETWVLEVAGIRMLRWIC